VRFKFNSDVHVRWNEDKNELVIDTPVTTDLERQVDEAMEILANPRYGRSRAQIVQLKEEIAATVYESDCMEYLKNSLTTE
jgi:hypothetical protein